MDNPELDTRSRILSETVRLMVERRGQKIRISDIAAAAGVSRQAVYLHFPNRTQLLIAAARYVDESNDIEQRLAPLRATRGGRQALRELIEFWGTYIPLIHDLARALLAVRYYDRAAAAAWADRIDNLYFGCRNAIQCLEYDGDLRSDLDPDRAADLLWSLLSIEVWENLTIERGWQVEQYIHWIQEAASRLLIKTI